MPRVRERATWDADGGKGTPMTIHGTVDRNKATWICAAGVLLVLLGSARAEAGFVLFNPNPATTDASGTVAVGVTIQAAEIGTFDVFDLALQSRDPALRLVDFRPSQEWLDLVWGATPFPIMPVPVGVVGGVLLTDVASLYLGDLVIDATGAPVEEYFVDVLNGSYLAHGFFFGDMMGELLFGSPLVVNVPEPSPAFLMLVCLLWALPTKRPPLSDGRGSDKRRRRLTSARRGPGGRARTGAASTNRHRGGTVRPGD